MLSCSVPSLSQALQRIICPCCVFFLIFLSFLNKMSARRQHGFCLQVEHRNSSSSGDHGSNFQMQFLLLSSEPTQPSSAYQCKLLLATPSFLLVFLPFFSLFYLLYWLLFFCLPLKRNIFGSLALIPKTGVISESSVFVWRTKARISPCSDLQGKVLLRISWSHAATIMGGEVR